MTTITPDSWLLNELLQDWVAVDAPALKIQGLCLDSRLVAQGDLYLALDGAQTHGMRFAESAVASGAVAVATSPDAIEAFSSTVQALRKNNVPVIAIDQLSQHCAQIASRFYREPDRSMTLIAVTGTDGKTSVCRFIAQAFGSIDLACGYIGTLGWGLGDELESTELTTPDVVTLRRMLASLRDQGATMVALEASSHGLAEGRLDGLSLDVAVLTNFGRDHLDYHKTIAAYRSAKAALFSWPSLSSIVINADDSLGQDLLQDCTTLMRFAYQVTPDRAHADNILAIQANHITAHDSGLRFNLIESGKSEIINSELLGRFNVENLLACYASLRACGVAANEACHSLLSVKPVEGRMERFGGENVPTVVVDFSHTPQALSTAIESVRVHCKGKLWVVFGCGGDRDPGKRAPMASAAQSADYVVLTDDNPRTESSIDIINAAMKGFTNPATVTVIADRAKAIKHAVLQAQADDLVLVAGKGHEDYQIIGNTKYPFSDRAEVLAALEVAS
ncbi:UDP-N-acetylmuramoyl-L-alanyl-D-glutamate--2,6-diaminopimelate ligase [Granulosicoccus sp.]|nr:UDP-N-acetylmuramoyl-L-alanyl-D-glutamate--2,6-diaminopimelate ligase [Granulosicoccus sp.]MDB4222813.1 UDP-N-acetylmuramoyl-L-alanyl-D-glutamate--2,6-diaminopimelate ligase [Granulosicoccus sp.]